MFKSRLVRIGAALSLTLGLVLVTSTPALAYPPVETVHTERIQAGPYGVTVGFSTWPIRAMRSLDFTFVPDGGIRGKTGTITLEGPGSTTTQEDDPLARHPRKRAVWGLDTESVPTDGSWRMRLTIDGPAGRGEGELENIPVLAQPGPPLALSWLLSTVPLWGLIALIVIAWRRTAPRHTCPRQRGHSG